MRFALLAVVAVVAVVAVLAAASPAHAGTGAGLERYLPDDTAEVLVFDVAHARTGPGASKLVELLHRHSDRWKAIADSGVDLAATIDTLVLAAAPDEDGRNRHQVAIVDGKLAVLLAHLPHAAAPATRVGAVTVFPIDGGGGEVAILDRHLIIASPGDLAAIIARGHRSPAAAAAALARGGTIATLRNLLATGAASGADANFSLDVQIAFVDEPAAATGAESLRRMFVGPDAQLRASIQTVIGPECADWLAIDRDRAQVHISAGMSVDEGERLGNLLGQAL